MILDINLETRQLIQVVLTQTGGISLLMHLFTIASLPVKTSLQPPLFSLCFSCRAMQYKQPQSREHFWGWLVFFINLMLHIITYF